MTKLFHLICSLSLLGALSACGGAASNVPGDPVQQTIPQVQHVVVTVVENADYSDVVDSPSMPYVNSLVPSGGLAANYYADHHPSLPNYFVIAAGMSPTTTDRSGVTNIDNAIRELTAASKSWKIYVEDLPAAPFLSADAGVYFRSFDAFSYLSDLQPPSPLQKNLVDLSQLAEDLAAGQLPAYSFIIPNAEHNGHTCPGGGYTCDVSTRLAAADSWLSATLPVILDDPQFQQSGLLLLTTDESRNDMTNGGGRVAMIVLGSGVKAGYVGNQQYDHRSLLSLSLTALGVKTIPNNAGSANQMTEFFSPGPKHP